MNKEKEFDNFLIDFPQYKNTFELDRLRAKEYSRLDKQGHVYLDYTGGGIYAESQLKAHLEILNSGIYGNPHSENPTSMASTKMVKNVRKSVLSFFNASEDVYDIVFTSNASSAIKLVAEAYPFCAKSKLMLLFDNHNSVNGMREYAHHEKAKVEYLPVYPPELRVNEEELTKCLNDVDTDGNNLFVYPAQSNFSGVQHSLEWIEKAQNAGWDVMLDAAAFVPSNEMDLSKWQPDFIPLSFYKMFGYPTGIGALIIKKTMLKKLKRPWFAGGTIKLASVQGETHLMHENHEGFEDGTVNYLGFPAVEIGLNHLKNIGMDIIHIRVYSLVKWLIDKLVTLKHDNGNNLVSFYGDPSDTRRGGNIAINLYDKDSKLIDFRFFEKMANEKLISIRTGCFCNPGASESHFGITKSEIIDIMEKKSENFNDYLEIIRNEDGKNAGGIRISFGVASNFDDAWKIYELIQSLLNK
ncbi:MAG: aminotransferase class V-fold PLP-dependent enzyme [Candidatus Marinimicrobia bacterium]|nr:aminotransferase class V-fold PLP-dependent enzyme [Candidatus Neomarinimicrobiota bacterium]